MKSNLRVLLFDRNRLQMQRNSEGKSVPRREKFEYKSMTSGMAARLCARPRTKGNKRVQLNQVHHCSALNSRGSTIDHSLSSRVKPSYKENEYADRTGNGPTRMGKEKNVTVTNTECNLAVQGHVIPIIVIRQEMTPRSPQFTVRCIIFQCLRQNG